MNISHLTFGHESNCLKLKVRQPVITPIVETRTGLPEAGLLIEMPMYNLDNVIAQLLEDYDEQTIIARIKSL